MSFFNFGGSEFWPTKKDPALVPHALRFFDMSFLNFVQKSLNYGDILHWYVKAFISAINHLCMLIYGLQVHERNTSFYWHSERGPANESYQLVPLAK